MRRRYAIRSTGRQVASGTPENQIGILRYGRVNIEGSVGFVGGALRYRMRVTKTAITASSSGFSRGGDEPSRQMP